MDDRRTTERKSVVPLKLTIELVPESSWGVNARGVRNREIWDRIRRMVTANADGICEICGHSARIECHEVWNYDDTTFVQSLVGVVALCHLCHAAKHPGRLEVGSDASKAVFEHYIKVNGVTRSQFQEQLRDAFTLWSERSKHQWRVDMSLIHELIKATGQTSYLDDSQGSQNGEGSE